LIASTQAADDHVARRGNKQPCPADTGSSRLSGIDLFSQVKVLDFVWLLRPR
jgi:hypothetical protein